MAVINHVIRDDIPNEKPKPVPEGDYLAMIVKSDAGRNKSGTGDFISLNFKIIDGQFKGRQIFDYINHKFDAYGTDEGKTKAQHIGQRHFNEICRALGYTTQVADTMLLHDKPLKITVGVKHDPGYDPKNEVKKAVPISGAAPVVPQQGANMAAGNQPQAPSAPPQQQGEALPQFLQQGAGTEVPQQTDQPAPKAWEQGQGGIQDL